MRRRLLALLADLAVVLVFATIGRASHDEGVTASGVAHVAAPFALGALLAALVTLIARRDPTTIRSGLSSWIWTLVIGMVVRHSLGDGTAVAFVIVAAVFLGALMVGWRAAAGRLRR